MNREQLKDLVPALSDKHKFRPVIIEKDFYITVILNSINTKLSDRIVFKGGTLLNKIYFDYKRLSEDLDFTFISGNNLDTRAKRSRAIKPIKDKMPTFLKELKLKSPKPEGEGFNESKQYIFRIEYPSIVTNKEELIKLEISLRQFPIDKPVQNTIKHFYQDPFTGENLLPSNKILSLSLNEAVAEKLKAAVTRRDLVIRDYYDLWHISVGKFDFKNKNFISIFKKKLKEEGFKGEYNKNFGLDEKAIANLTKQIDSALIPVIRINESFDLKKVLKRFNKILSAI
ncbi:nucleotidyl transferase AbiEii/AbiGii toxin family protein [bacterium]|nr:nucleotidyl transferase AbiEii/AbiGii toxin family protein [bacterium]MCG2676850.1 nucleotidyl transferase AbiEii/AbiGii toxin family protein [bacterium]